MQVFNSRAVTRQQRFVRAIIFGSIAAIGLAIIYGIISSLTRFEFSVVYVGIGYLIGMVISKYGRGVQVQFSVLAAVLAVISFILGDIISMFGISVLWTPYLWGFGLQAIFYALFAPTGVISLAFRVFGVFYAYKCARGNIY